MIDQNTTAAKIATLNYLYRNPITSYLHRAGLRTTVKMFSLKNAKIIDLGSGRGDIFKYLRGYDITGLEIDEKLIAHARQNFPDIPLILGSIYDIPFPNNTFDVATATGTLEHLKNLPQALLEIKRILKPNGELIVLIPTENFLYKIGRKLTVAKYIEKKFNVDYDLLLKEEHVNTCKEVLKQLSNFFTLDKTIGVPCILPCKNINIFLIVRCKK